MECFSPEAAGDVVGLAPHDGLLRRGRRQPAVGLGAERAPREGQRQHRRAIELMINKVAVDGLIERTHDINIARGGLRYGMEHERQRH